MQKNKTDYKKRDSGLIIGAILAFLSYVKKLAQGSAVLSWFEDYQKLENKCKNSFFAKKLSALSAIKFKLINFKMTCAKQAQESLIIAFFNRIFIELLSTPLRSYGVFFLSYGMFTVLLSVARNTERILTLQYSDSFVFGFIMVVISLFLIPVKKKSVCTALKESSLFSYILRDVFLSDFVNSDYYIAKPISGISFILGIAFGVISYLTSPVLIGFVVFLAVILYMVFSKPENGLLLICLLLPFLPSKILTFLVMITALSALSKIIRGKRSLYLNISSGILLLFALIALSSAMFSYDSVNAVSKVNQYLVSLLLGILMISLIRSSRMAERCYKLLSVSAVAAALFGFYDCAVIYIKYRDFSGILSSIIKSGMTSTFANSDYFGAYLICLLPIMFLRFKSRTKLLTILSMCLLSVCLILSNSYYAIVSLISAFVITMLIFSKHGILTTSVSVALILFFNFMMPTVSNTSLGKYISYFNGNSSEHIFGVPEFISEFWLHGVGSGTGSVAYATSTHTNTLSAYSSVGGSYLALILKIGIPLVIMCIILFSVFFVRLTSYALGKYNYLQAKNNCTALFCSLTGIVIYAMFSDFILDFKLFLLVILVASLGSATADSADNDYIPPSVQRDGIYY